MRNRLSHLLESFIARSRRARRRRKLPGTACESLEIRQLPAVTSLQAFHRSGQTFLTWTEDGSVTGEEYNVYRSNSPITTASLSTAQKLTSRWGPLNDGTSLAFKPAPDSGVPSRLVINDLATPLADNKGLFVWTTQPGDSGTWYYAVTQVTNGTESLSVSAGSSSLSTGVTELVATPQPVLTVSTNGGKGRIYTQYMDYANWNPTFAGYAFHYSVALPDNYTTSRTWPLKVLPHAYGERFRMEPSSEYGWPAIEIFLDDPPGGAPGTSYHTWWYGFAADHNYRTGGQVPTTGVIENFTEQRVLRTIDEVKQLFTVNPELIHAQGNSMGASGALSLGIRYPNVFSAIFASQPMTNYGTSPGFQTDFTSLWGSQASNLPIVNHGPYAAALTQYNNTGVYDWMNHQLQLVNRRGDDMAWLMVGHGKADDIIDWQTQGRPIIAALNAASAGFTAEQRFGWDHNWMSFDFALDEMFSPTDPGLSDFAYPRSVSFPAITNATGSGPNVPGTSGTDFYNRRIEWSVPWNSFHSDIVDSANRYEVTLRSTNGSSQVADVTPRRTQAFDPLPGTGIAWQNIETVSGQVVQSGLVIVDADGLATIPGVQIGTGTGHRLVLTVQLLPPAIQSPVGATGSQTPTLSWTPAVGAVSYDVWITNLSTNTNPQLQTTVTGTQFTPATPLGIGRYRAWVRSRSTSGQLSAWSSARDFQITTAPVLTPITTPVYSGQPSIAWSELPGAAKYDLWINNASTGQTQVIRQTALTANSYQVTSDLGLGKYTVWVRGLDISGTAGQWSTAMQFTSASRAVADSPGSPTFDSTPDFIWQPVPGANRYEVSVVNRTTNAVAASAIGLTTTTWTPTSALPAGNYRWWVRGSSTTSGIVGAWSVPLDFSTGGRPVVLTSGTTSDRTPTIQWTPVAGAVRYELWVSRLDGSGVVINVTNLTAAVFTPASELAPASYRIWVRAVSTTNVVSDWSLPVDLTITDRADNPWHSLLDEDHPLLTELNASADRNRSAVVTSQPEAAAPAITADADAKTPPSSTPTSLPAV
jgi:hypothetical protein